MSITTVQMDTISPADVSSSPEQERFLHVDTLDKGGVVAFNTKSILTLSLQLHAYIAGRVRENKITADVVTASSDY